MNPNNYADRLWIEGISAEERARLDRYGKAWAAYFGEMPDTIKVKPGQPDDNIKANFARVIVDAGVSYLFGQEPTFELDEGKERSAPEQYLDEVWRANHKMQLLQKVATNGAVCGHAYVKIVPPKPGQRFPRLINLSPEYVNVVCDPDDIDEVWRYVIQYPARGKNGERLVIRQTVERLADERWELTDEISVNDGKWQTRQSLIWPFRWSPIVDCQNRPSPNEYYGIADIEPDVLAMNRSINFTLSNLQRILRFHAHPKTWGKGFQAQELRVAVDETIVLPSPDASIQNLEMLSDLSSSIEYYRRLKEALHEISNIPEVATGKLDSAGQLSGVALAILYTPILQRTEQKRLTYGELLVELNRRLLDMAGFGEENVTEIHWPQILPGNEMEERQVALIDKQLGVSPDTILQRLGYDPDLEREKAQTDSNNMADALLGAFDRGDVGMDSRTV